MKNILIQGVRILCILAALCLVYVNSAVEPLPKSLAIVLFGLILAGLATANHLDRKNRSSRENQ